MNTDRQPFTRSAMLAPLRDKRRNYAQARVSPLVPVMIILGVIFWGSMAVIAFNYFTK